jgi:lipid-A-disaccharide synthase
MSEVLLAAGDASGDAHAAELVAALRARLPDVRCFGLGGSAMERAGVEILVPQRELAIGGLVEVLGSLSRVFSAWRRLERAARERRPSLVILVDSPEFNLPLARRLRRCGAPILYYIAPQVWAWRTGRVRKIARRVDRVAVIFPFEVPLFAAAGVRVDFVGHPGVERLRELRARLDRAGARAELGLEPARPLVALLPGSRHNEVRRGTPLQLAAARCLRALAPQVAFALALAPTVRAADVAPALSAAAGAGGPPVRIVEGRTHELLLAADVALAKPGTATLEAALLGCPIVACGRANPLTALVIRRMIHVASWTMPNLIAGAPVVPEFLQEAAVPERIAAAIAELLAGPARALQLARLEAVARRLGPGGAAARAASVAEEMMRGRVA